MARHRRGLRTLSALCVAAFTLCGLAVAEESSGWLSRGPGQFRQDVRLPGTAQELAIFGSTWDASKSLAWFATESGLYSLDSSGGWTRFGRAEGLPSEVTRAVAVDGRGRAWCGTAAGPAFMEGAGFRRVEASSGGPLTADVWTICHDGETTWIGTDEGLFEVSDGRVRRRFTTREAPLGENWISGVAADGKGNVWVAVWLGGVARFDGKGWTAWRDPDGRLEADERPDDGLLSDAATSVAIEAGGTIAVGTSSGVSQFDGWRWRDAWLGPVSYVEPAREGRTLLAGTPDGLLILESGLARRYHRSAELLPAGAVSGQGSATGRTRGALPSGEVFTAAEAGGRIFVGTRKGLAVLEMAP
ncbi:MAG: hypothetical protein HY816_06445 [Candidatus Wallbacteria bacterium]|nr:hypothetical protein [Candidatus Wallbacteria bacterium]